MKIWYYSNVINAGDFYNQILAERLYNDSILYSKNPDVCFTGSVLAFKELTNAIIAGCGVHTESPNNVIQLKESNVRILRGNLSKNILINKGILNRINNIAVGDPGLLASLLFPRQVSKKYKVGVILHYLDNKYYDEFKAILPKTATIIKMDSNNLENIFNQICECEYTISSSLHGLIFSHSFGVPSFHFTLSKLMDGKLFKVYDYYSVFPRLSFNDFKLNTPADINEVIQEINYKFMPDIYSYVPSLAEVKKIQNNILLSLPFRFKLKEDIQVMISNIENQLIGKVAVALTSYPKRINLCAKVVESVFNGIMKPDILFLTLDPKEFPKKELDLPTNLVRLKSKLGEKFKIVWVDNLLGEENMKSVKKVFPILEFLDDNDVIMTLDDDVIVDKNLLNSRVIDYINSNGRYAITANFNKTVGFDKTYIISVTSLLPVRGLRNWDYVFTKNEISFYNDDRMYLYMLYLNGIQSKPGTHFLFNTKNDTVKFYAYYKDGMTTNNEYVVGKEFDLKMEKRINDCFGIKINNAFGKLRDQRSIIKNSLNIKSLQPPKNHYDIIYVLGFGTNFNDRKIKISISSMLRYCGDWINKIYIIGKDPKIKNPLVSVIHCHNIYPNKEANIIYKIKTAVTKIPTLSDDFLVCFDNQVVTHPMKFSDFKPKAVNLFDPDNPFFKSFSMSKAKWNRNVFSTMMRFYDVKKSPIENQVYFYHPHLIYPFNKNKFIELLGSVDGNLYSGDIILSCLYFNTFKPKNVEFLNESNILDCIFKPSEYTKYMIDQQLKVPDIVCYDDQAFRFPAFQKFLAEIIKPK